MKTVTLGVLDDKALSLLKDLELLNVVKLHAPEKEQISTQVNSLKRYKGLMSKQSLEDVNKQLHELRNEWE